MNGLNESPGFSALLITKITQLRLDCTPNEPGIQVMKGEKIWQWIQAFAVNCFLPLFGVLCFW